MNENDHDLLIELRTEMKNLRGDVRELKDNVATRVSNLETEKADKTEVSDHESRLRKLEKFGWMIAGALLLVQIAIKVLWK